MPSVPDTSHLPWWLGPSESPSDALIKGVQAGSAIASNILRAKQISIEAEGNFRREETATKLKLMDLSQQGERDKNMVNLKMIDLGLEGERNDIAIRTQQQKQDLSIGRANAMLELGDYMGNAVRNDKLTDPETIAGWHELTSRVAPFVPDSVANTWYDNTFKPAMERKEKAEGISKESTALKQNSAYLQALDKSLSDAVEKENEAMDLGTPEEQAQAKSARETAERNKEVGFQIARVREPGASPVTPWEVTGADGKKQVGFMDFKGNVHYVNPPKDGLSALQRMQYGAERRTIQWKLSQGAGGFSPSEKLDKKETDSETASRQVKALDERFGSIGDSSAPSSGTKDYPHKPATPSEASKLNPGEWFMTPDGRLIQRK